MDLHLHFHDASLHRITSLLEQLMTGQADIVSQLSDAKQTLDAVLAQQQKTAGEITVVQGSVTQLQAQVVTLEAKIAELQGLIDAGASGTATQELVDAVAALQTSVASIKQQAQLIDDQIPDVPVAEPAPEGVVTDLQATASE